MTYLAFQVWGHVEDTNIQEEVKSKDFLLSSSFDRTHQLLAIIMNTRTNSWLLTSSLEQKL